MTEEDQVIVGDRVDSFLKDEAVKKALYDLDARYFKEFKTAKTDDDRRIAQAKANVLTDFALELRATVDRATTIKLNNVKPKRAV